MTHDDPTGPPPDEGDEPELPPDEGDDAPRPGRGRPCKLTPALRDKALQLLRQGLSRPAVAGAIRVGASTFAEWIARGEGRDDRPDRPETDDFADFAEATVSGQMGVASGGGGVE